MGGFDQEYKAKLTTPDEILDGIKPGSTIQLGVWYGEPYGMIRALDRRAADIAPLYVSGSIATAPCEYLNHPEAYGLTGFYGPVERASQAANGNIYYTPTQFTDGARMIKTNDPFDYFIYRVRPMDERGYFNCSLTASWEFSAIKWIHENHPQTKIVFEVNDKLPFIHGLEQFGSNEIHVSDVDLVIEDDAELLNFPVEPPSEIERRIAAHVATLIEDRATIQLGFGGIPMAIGKLLAEKRELGIHTEMFCDAHLDLIEAGAVTNAHKGLYDGVSVATFCLGGERLRNWLADNREFAALPVEYLNSVPIVAQVNNMAGVNSILTIDLAGQACAHCLGPRTYSGLGGAFEFASGCPLSPGGKAISCLPSTTTLKDGSVVSNIVLHHPAGTRICTPEHTIDWVATEFGAVRLKCLNMEHRAAALISIAHPDFREQLERDASQSGLRLSNIRKLPPPPGQYFSRAD